MGSERLATYQIYTKMGANGLILLALGHAAMLIFHQAIKKDVRLIGMIRPQK